MKKNEFPPKPDYSKNQINHAGEIAAKSSPSSQDYKEAVKIINEWRISHGYPMHTFNISLRKHALLVDKTAIVARRLKRLPTILDKIGKRNTTRMMLSRMQDIGGVRAIMKGIPEVYALYETYTEPGRFTHKLKATSKDYIREPKSSGYRGIHLVYEFHNTQGRNRKSRQYDGLCVEIQIRTQEQHKWATAVETVGVLLHEDLKSGRGDKKWLEFFQCMASVIATVEEQPVLEDHRNMSSGKLYEKTAKLAKKLNVVEVISGLATGANEIIEGKKGSHYNILRLDPKNNRIYISGFNEEDYDKAVQELEIQEMRTMMDGLPEPVLVAAGDLKSLKSAYPNYFLDIHAFLNIVRMVVKATGREV